VTVTVALLFTVGTTTAEQLMEYVVVTLGVTVTFPDDVAFPVEKPVPVQESAFVEDQVSVDELLLEGTLAGFAVKVAVISWATVCV
jgi:hypothetical protein